MMSLIRSVTLVRSKDGIHNSLDVVYADGSMHKFPISHKEAVEAVEYVEFCGGCDPAGSTAKAILGPGRRKHEI